MKEEAIKLEDENYEFRTFLKIHADEEELDKQFHSLHKELFENYDCSKCRNCCREFEVVLEKGEIEAIAGFLHISRESFISDFTKENHGEHQLNEIPCRFLNADNTCQIESCKPRGCVEYPNTDKPGRLWSLLGIIASASVCPVVCEILQRLKLQYKYK